MTTTTTILPPFFIALGSEELPAPYLIIQRDPPNWVAKVIQFKTDDDLAHFKANSNNVGKFYQCAGYRIGILLVKRVHPEMTSYFVPGAEMAKYFLTHKIKMNEQPFKRYKIE